MSHVPCPRRSMMLALLATTAAASLLGACGHGGGGGGLFSRSGSAEVQMTAGEAAKATSQWAVAYAKNPTDPKMALGYAKSLRALGSKDRSFDILKKAYRANPDDGQVAAELGRVALEMGRVDVASRALESAASEGVTDWKTLSAQGTLRAKKGEHAKAQEYYLAALKKEPDAPSIINNLALSYALDGKASESEALLRKAAENGHDDRRIRQNLALVLGVQGKFDEARQVAAVDMNAAQAKSSMSYLRNMMAKPTKVASKSEPQGSLEDWSPFGTNAPTEEPAPVQTASRTAAPKREVPKVTMVKPVDEVVESPAKVASAQTGAAQTGAPSAPRSITPASLFKADVE